MRNRIHQGIFKQIFVAILIIALAALSASYSNIALAEGGGPFDEVKCLCNDHTTCAGPVDCTVYNGNGWTCEFLMHGNCETGWDALCKCTHPTKGRDDVTAIDCSAFIGNCEIW